MLELLKFLNSLQTGDAERAYTFLTLLSLELKVLELSEIETHDFVIVSFEYWIKSVKEYKPYTPESYEQLIRIVMNRQLLLMTIETDKEGRRYETI